ncbi:ribulose-phosphate 3-epimerase [Candidatus Contubernalis alkaliaceticus]|uniref:ribulose-phosphate 3-epimerase n=1 Tax=Candidatus Contubernalis alkaliaceticus TaxID=338645 RepID=UPI001F4BE6EF|nr:ribulose-phosphate 3-epimerase [Candidatus Contubernalis alkalaceticus]UNC92781.1 ribulose-phosphate 3-epimerase [Candidatus Contubernalis alkalaceticus]
MVKIAPSILSADFAHLYEEIKQIEEAGADWIHIDVMDGHFVPNISIGLPVVESLRGRTGLPLDVHLMISNPEQYIERFVEAGAAVICVHAEASIHLHRTIELIKERGVLAGVALNPATPLSVLDYVLTDLDMVLVMSVNPGFGGQKFIPTSLKKISALREWIDRERLSVLIQVDGGINSETAPEVIGAGADILVAGSAVFSGSDVRQAINMLRTEKKVV